MGDSMSTIINATTTNGVVIQPDNSGSLVLQTNSGTTALTIDTSQRAAFVAGTAALPAITTTGDTNTGMFFPAADTIAFAEGGTEVMRIDSASNVLVGTTTTAGAASNNALVVGGVFNSLNGTTASLANGASASIVTSTANLSFYQVFANCVGNTTVFASALIYFNGAGTATVQSIMGTGMSISSSGANIITVTNSAGSSQQISWTVIRYK
jgi:hypothetical protein